MASLSGPNEESKEMKMSKVITSKDASPITFDNVDGSSINQNDLTTSAPNSAAAKNSGKAVQVVTAGVRFNSPA